MPTKYVVIDTNVILSDPFFIRKIANATIIIPPIVLQELDSFKKDNELGRNVRIFSNIMDQIYDNDFFYEESLTYIYIPFRDANSAILESLGGATPDNLIIETAEHFSKNHNDVTLLSNDILVRIKARGLGLSASEFTSDNLSDNLNMIYPGYTPWETYGRYIDILYSEKFLMISNELKENINPHMFFKITEINGNRSAIAKVNEDCTKLELVNPDIKPIWGISPKNDGQRMLLQLLLDPEISLVTVSGKAGTGKTLLSLASGLVLSADEDFYDKLVLTKPVVPMGKDIGYLPGSKEEKLNPWLASYYDNLEFLLGNKYSGDYGQLNIEIDALTYIRGRSLPRQYIIIDEAQNLTKHEVKSIITRAGEGSKVVLMGDPDQVDAPYLDSINNGLVYTINKFKDQSIAGHISLEKSERSKLAEIAANIL